MAEPTAPSPRGVPAPDGEVEIATDGSPRMGVLACSEKGAHPRHWWVATSNDAWKYLCDGAAAPPVDDAPRVTVDDDATGALTVYVDGYPVGEVSFSIDATFEHAAAVRAALGAGSERPTPVDDASCGVGDTGLSCRPMLGTHCDHWYGNGACCACATPVDDGDAT